MVCVGEQTRIKYRVTTMSRFAIVGCTHCTQLWIIKLNDDLTTQCPRCGRQYARHTRQHFAETDTREAAVKRRGELLRDRAGG